MKISLSLLLLVMMARSSASDLTATTVEGIEEKPIEYQARHVAIFGRITMKFESTYLEACNPRGGSSGKFIDLLLYDDVLPATESQAKQLSTNLRRYAPFDKKCGWVVGVFDSDDSMASVPSL